MSILLCVEKESLFHAEAMGLAGENAETQAWLKTSAYGEECRALLREDESVREVWIVSCSDVHPLNLAATLKRDRPGVRVAVLVQQRTGSYASRAAAAGVDELMSRQSFVVRYAQKKAQAALTLPSPKQYPEEEFAAPASAPSAEVSGAVQAAKVVSVESVKEVPDDPFAAEEPRIVVCAGTETAEALSSSIAEVRFSDDRESLDALRADAAQPELDLTHQERQPFLLTVVSGSGGAGKSTVALLSAYLASRMGLKTLLWDCDYQFGDMREMMGIDKGSHTCAIDIDEALRNVSRLNSLRGKTGAPALLAAPRHLEQSELAERKTEEILSSLGGSFDVVVANTGAAWGESHMLLLERTSKALFLVDQRKSSLRACQHALDVCERCGIASSPFVFVANKTSKGSLFTSLDVACAMRGAASIELPDGGRDVEELLGAGLPLELIEDGNPLVKSLQRVLAEILPQATVDVEALEQKTTFVPRGFFGKGRARKRKACA